MACTNSLLNLLEGSPETGGIWYYMGMYFEPLSPTYQDIGDTGSGLYASSTNDPITNNGYSVGERVIAGGSNPTIFPHLVIFDDFIPGLPNLNSDGLFVAFEYVQGIDNCGTENCLTYGDWDGYCDVARLIIQVLPQPCAGEDIGISLCTDDSTEYDIREQLGLLSSCSVVPAGTQEGVIISTITYANGDPITDGVDGITITNGGTPSEIVTFDASTVAQGTYSFKNTVIVNNDFDVECTSCNDFLEATVTFNVTEYEYPGTLLPAFDPYAVVCDDPSCTLNWNDMFTGTINNGTWTYKGIYAGGATDGNNEPIYTGCDCSIPTTASCSLYYGVDTTGTPGETVVYQYACPGDNLVASTTGEYYFDQTDLDTTYTFEYNIGIGTACPFTRWAFVRLEIAADAGTPPPDYIGCIKDFTGLGYNNNNEEYDLWTAIGNPPNQNGTWTITLLTSVAGSPTSPFNQGDIDGWFNAATGVFDFTEFKETYDAGVEIEFSYESTVSGNTVCPACAGSDTSTWTLKLGSGCDLAGPTNSDNSDYTNIGSPYLYSAPFIFWSEIMKDVEGFESCAFNRVRFAAGQSGAETIITDLRVANDGVNFQQRDYSGASTIYGAEQFTNATANAVWDLSLVPPGTYAFSIEYGSTNTVDGDFINCVASGGIFYFFIEVEGCDGCNQVVTLIY